MLLSLPSISATPTYIYGPNGLTAMIDENNNIYYFISDYVSTFLIVNGSGTIVYESKFEPDGNVIEEQGQNPSNIDALGYYDED